MDEEKIKSTIRSLLNLAKDDAAMDGEIDNALRFAKKLLDEHHLTEADLQTEPKDQYRAAENAPKDQAPAAIGLKCHAWESMLGKFVSDLVGVPYYLDHGRRIVRDRRGIAICSKPGRSPIPTRAFIFYGIAEDAWFASELFGELRYIIAGIAQLKFGGVYRGDGGMYCQGFVEGLRKKNCQHMENNLEHAKLLATNGQSNALVLIERRKDLIAHKKEVATDWLTREHKIKLCRGSCRSGARGSRAAHREGKTDGQQYGISPKRTKKLTN